MRHPTIHLNGSSAKTMYRDLRDVAFKLSETEGALVMAAPHPRDYYTQGGSAFSEAKAEFDAQAAKLQEVRDYLATQLEYLINYL